jgi:hypothetical protein
MSVGDFIPWHFDPAWLWYVAVAAFGAGVGASELIARYRDAPFLALRTGAARWYIFVNCAAALAAYTIIVSFDWSFGAEPGQKAWVQALVAGFSSMVFFRSSLLTMRIGDTDVPFGPGIFFQVLLFATDRECDRARAGPRSDLVNQIMKGVSFDQARDALPSYCFELMQNVPASEQQRFRQVVDALASSRMRDNVKVLNLGLMLMNVVGSRVLNAAVRALGVKIQGPAKLELEVITRLQAVHFAKAFPLLVDVSFIMSQFGTDEERAKAKQAVLDEVGPLTANPAIDNGTKMTILALSLQTRVGDAVLLSALVNASDGIKAEAPAPPAEKKDAADSNLLPFPTAPATGENAGGGQAGAAGDDPKQDKKQ